MSQPWDDLISRFEQGDVRALARMITLVENRSDGWAEAMDRIHPRAGHGLKIGITGPAGAGKSTLVSALARVYALQGVRTAILSVDPSSPFTNGALLGDRIRMSGLAGLGVFIRSMATRDGHGGLSRAARDAVRLLEAFGHEIVLIETVGAGQDEVEIVRLADVVAVVCVPGLGDGVQALKAGLLEIADVFVVNKADQPGTDQLLAELALLVALTPGAPESKPPVFRTVALRGEGAAELAGALREQNVSGRGRKPRSESVADEAARIWAEEIGKLAVRAIENLAPPAGASPYRVMEEQLHLTEARNAVARLLARCD